MISKDRRRQLSLRDVAKFPNGPYCYKSASSSCQWRRTVDNPKQRRLNSKLSAIQGMRTTKLLTVEILTLCKQRHDSANNYCPVSLLSTKTKLRHLCIWVPVIVKVVCMCVRARACVSVCVCACACVYVRGTVFSLLYNYYISLFLHSVEYIP